MAELGGEGQPGAGEGGAGGTGGGGGATPSTVGEFLKDSPLATEASLANYLGGSVEDLAKGMVSAQKLVGANPASVLKIPTMAPDEEGGAEAWGEFYGKLGRPESLDGYKVPDDIANNLEPLGLSPDILKSFAEVAHGSGLTDKQHEAMLAWYKSAIAEPGMQAQQQEQAAAEQKTQAELAALKAEWASGYDGQVQLANRAIDSVGEEDAAAFRDWLEENNLQDSVPFIRFFAKMGQAFKEDSAGSGGATDYGMTPAQAMAALAEKQADAAFVQRLTDTRNPGHAAAVAERERLFRLAYPETGA